LREGISSFISFKQKKKERWLGWQTEGWTSWWFSKMMDSKQTERTAMAEHSGRKTRSLVEFKRSSEKSVWARHKCIDAPATAAAVPDPIKTAHHLS
jgi:hypothetical protein